MHRGSHWPGPTDVLCGGRVSRMVSRGWRSLLSGLWCPRPQCLSLGMTAPSIQCSPPNVSPACPVSPQTQQSLEIVTNWTHFHPGPSFCNFQFIKKGSATTTGLSVPKRGCLPSLTPSLSPHIPAFAASCGSPRSVCSPTGPGHHLCWTMTWLPIKLCFPESNLPPLCLWSDSSESKSGPAVPCLRP